MSNHEHGGNKLKNGKFQQKHRRHTELHKNFKTKKYNKYNNK